MKILTSVLFILALSSCSQSAADQQERDKYCRGDDCYLESTKYSEPPKSSGSGWVPSPSSMERDPNAGSDKPLFGGSSNPNTVPTDTGCVEPCGNDGSEGPVTTTPPPTQDREPPGKGTVLSRIGNDIGKAFTGISGAFNGSNNKKRKKAREAQRVLDDAKDVMAQADGYGASISSESQAITNLSTSIIGSQKGFEAAASDSAFDGIIQRYDGKTMGILDKTPDVDERGLTEGRGTGIYHEAAKIEGARKYVKYAEGKVEGFKGQADYEARKGLVTIADEAVTASEESYKEGNLQEGNIYYEMGMAVADIALSVTPIVGVGKDFIEASWGHSILDGHKLTGVEQSMAAVGVLTLGLGKVGVFSKIGKLGRIIGRAARNGDEAARAAKSISRAELIASKAERAGIKGKGLLNDIVEEMKVGHPCTFAEVRPLQNFWALFESTAYAADCIPGEAEKLLEGALDGFAKAKNQIKEITSATAKWPEDGHALERLLQRDVTLEQAKKVMDEGSKFYDTTRDSIVFFADRTSILGDSGSTKLIGVAVDGSTMNVKTVLRESRTIEKLPKGRFLPL